MNQRQRSLIGTSVPRLDGHEKVTGRAIYASDITLPAMLHGKVLRSSVPHARIRRVDSERAEKLPGVAAVLTRAHLAGFKLYGAAYKDQSIVALDKVRYVGDPVAAVAAVDELTAAEALELITVDYEELPAAVGLDEALAPDAPLVHEAQSAGGEIHGYRYQAGGRFKGTNVCYQFSYGRGNVDAAFRKAAHIFDDTFTFPRVHHYSLEPHVTVADFDGERIVLWASSQDPFTLREHLAEIFSLPQNKVRIIVPYVGAGFGGKLSVKNEPLAIALSWKARRPVKLAYSVEESFKTVTRHAARFRIKTGVSRSGRITARECEVYMDTGAYADAGPRVTQKAGYRAPGPYRIPNLRTNAYTVYTNTVPAGAFRGFGTLQVTWAYESQMDIIADKLGIDPLEFRLKNLLKKGAPFTAGDTPVDCDLGAGLLKAANYVARKPAHKKKAPHGVGLSCCMKDGGGTYKIASATVKMTADGSVLLSTGTVEIGQGARTALSQIIAAELAVPVDRIRVVELDTDTTPYDISTNASSSTVVMGLSVLRASRDLKKQLLMAAAPIFQASGSRLTLKNGRVYNRRQSLSYEDIIARSFGIKAGEITGKGFYQDKKSRRAVLGSPTTFWEISWGGARVAVDSETGQLHVNRYVSLADVGRAINPAQCLGQDHGAVVMALGHSLLEEMIYREGQPVNANLIAYRIPRFRDLPDELRSVLIENENGPGPYGSKGTGEGGLLPVASALANAVADAVGARLYDLPLTPEKVWRAMTNKAIR